MDYNKNRTEKESQISHSSGTEDYTEVTDEEKKGLIFRILPLPFELDLGAYGFAALVVILTFGSYALRDKIVDFESFDKFRDKIKKFSIVRDFSHQMILVEFIRYFSVCAYDFLVILYLVKPIVDVGSYVDNRVT